MSNVRMESVYDDRIHKQGKLNFGPASDEDPNENSRSKRDGVARADHVLGKFPDDLGIHFMSFNFRKARHGRSFGGIQYTFDGTAFLPMPGNLIDAFNINYNDVELGVVGGGTANFVQGSADTVDTLMAKGKEILNTSLADIGEKVLATTNKVKEELTTNLGENSRAFVEGASTIAREGTGGLSVGLNRLFGNIPNPNVTALFRGVGLKSHSFEWKLAPRNRKETDSLFKIIHAFKYTALPDLENQNTRMTMGFPDECIIKIHGTNASKSGVETMIMFKPCVLKNVTVNYTPDGTPSFFAHDGYPTAVTLKLDLQETMIHTKKDYPKDLLQG